VFVVAPVLALAGCGLPGGGTPPPPALDLPVKVSGTLDSSNPSDSYRFNLSDGSPGIRFTGDCEPGIHLEWGALEAGGSGDGGCNEGPDASWSIADGAAHGFLDLSFEPGQSGPLTYEFTVTESGP
jgi:hypothetical protein